MNEEHHIEKSPAWGIAANKARKSVVLTKCRKELKDRSRKVQRTPGSDDYGGVKSCMRGCIEKYSPGVIYVLEIAPLKGPPR